MDAYSKIHSPRRFHPHHARQGSRRAPFLPLSLHGMASIFWTDTNCGFTKTCVDIETQQLRAALGD